MTKTLTQFEKDLIEAKATFDAADGREKYARNERADALNRLNDAQKAFDAALADLRMSMPHDSDWKRLTTRNAEAR